MDARQSMTDKRIFRLVHNQARAGAIQAIRDAPDGYMCVIQQPTRTLDQNAYQWPYLEGFSNTLQWPVNGRMEKLKPEEWKDILTAAFELDVNPRIAAGLDGGMVMLGRKTREFGKKKFAEWMEFLMATAADRGVEPVFKSSSPRWQSE